MNISIDIDGVLASFTEGAVRVGNKIFPEKNIPLDYQPPLWDFPCYTKEEWSQIWTEIHNTPNFWLNLPAHMENVHGLEKYIWEPKSADIFFITSRVGTAGDSVLEQTTAWLRNHGLYRSGHTSVIPVAGPKYKNMLMSALNIKFSLDDYGPTVVECNCNNEHKAFLLDRNWNREYIALPRLYSMKEYLDIVRKV